MPKTIYPKEYRDWAAKYCAAFGLDRDSDKAMVQTWQKIFEDLGYSVPELEKALTAIARNPPKFRSEHLSAINQAINCERQRLVYESMEVEAAIDEFEQCKQCSSAGWVFVPHPRFLKDGEWIYGPGGRSKPLCTVTCGCQVGQRLAGIPRTKKAMSLESYEELNPEWREQIEIHEAGKKALREAQAAANAGDKSLGELISEIGKEPSVEDRIKQDRRDQWKQDHERLRDMIPHKLRDSALKEKFPETFVSGPQGPNKIAENLESQLFLMKTE